MQRHGSILVRLLVLAVLVLGAAGVITWAWHYRQRETLADARDARIQGLAALEMKQYSLAVRFLQKYLKYEPYDVPALYAFAQARMQAPGPEKERIEQAIGALRLVVQQKPHFREAQLMLLELYVQVGADQQIVDLADQILARHPNDETANRAKAFALARLHRYHEALEPAQQLNRAAPLDVVGQMLTFSIMHKLGTPTADIVARAVALEHEHPDDARPQLLRAVACRMAGDDAQARTHLQQAVSLPRPDVAFAWALVQQLDALRLFEQSLAVLEQSATQFGNGPLKRELVRRLWQRARFEQLAVRVSSWPPQQDATLQGYHAMALAQLGKIEQARSLADDLRAQGGELQEVWSALVLAATAQQADPAALISLVRDAAARGMHDPLWTFMLGQACRQIDEHELALRTWHELAQQEITWAQPCVEMARLLLALDQPAQAVELARHALWRQDTHVEAALLLASALIASTGAGAEIDRAEIDGLLIQLERAPQVAQPVKLLRIAWLAQTGERGRAIELAEPMLRQRASVETLLQLTSLSRQHQLGLEDRALEQAWSTGPLTPGLVWARAMALKGAGETGQGMEAIQRVRGSRPEQGPLWFRLEAQYLDQVNPAAARSTWERALARWPGNIELHRAAMQSPSVAGQRELAERVIEVVREHSPPDGSRWRLGRAQWLLAHGQGDRGAAEAAVLVRQSIEVWPHWAPARILLARCLEKLHDLPGAMAQLKTASQLDPSSNAIALELARVLQAHGDFVLARSQIQKVTSREGRLVERCQAAALLIEQGQLERALDLLEEIPKHQRANNSSVLLLMAQVRSLMGDRQEADQLCAQLLEQSDPAALEFAAAHYASTGRSELALTTLARLKETKLAPGERELALARHLQRFGSAEQATAQWIEATQAAPGRADAWRQRISWHFECGQVTKGLEAAREALTHLSSEPALASLVARADVIKAAARHDASRPLLAAWLEHPEQQAVIASGLQVLAGAEAATPAAAAGLRQLADQQPRFLPLQMAAIKAYLALGQADRAAFVAARTADLFPTTAQPSAVAAQVLLSTGRYQEALERADQWQAVNPGDAPMADALAAQAHLGLGNPEAALARLQPHLEQALAAPDRWLPVMQPYLQALAAVQQHDRAHELLQPLLDQAPWRKVMRDLAVTRGPDARAAQWLKELEPYVLDADDPQELLAQARAWLALHARTADDQPRQAARRLLTRIAQRKNPLPPALVLLGVLADQDQRIEEASLMYRKAVELDSQQTIALNNLALILTHEDRTLDQALKLAESAVAQAPHIPQYRDTLATVHARRGDFRRAIEERERAMRLEPSNPKWHIRLVQILLDGGQLQDAQKAMRSLDEVLSYNGPLAPELQKHLEGLQKNTLLNLDD